MFPAMLVPWPLTLGSSEVKGGQRGHILRRDGGVTMAMSACPRGPALCLLHFPLPSTSAAALLSQKRLREWAPRVPRQLSQGLQQGCREKAVRGGGSLAL